MLFLTLEDIDGVLDVLLFPEVYQTGAQHSSASQSTHVGDWCDGDKRRSW